MRASRNNGVLVRGLAVAGALVWGISVGLPLPAQAQQTGGPVRLGPPPAASPTPPTATPAPAQVLPRGISADNLSAPSIDSAGALDGKEGLPPTLWAGASRGLVAALVPRIATTTSPALQGLARALLASAATPPAGEGDSGLLLALRAERLTNGLGRPDLALRLFQAVPDSQRGPDLARVASDLAFLAGDLDEACRAAKSGQGGDGYWDQARATCQALSGDTAGAQFSLDILRESQPRDDGFGPLVLRALGVNAHLPDSLPAPQPMALVLLAKAGDGVPRKALEGLSPPLARAIALNGGFPPDQRLFAAERAASTGAIGPERLAQAWIDLPLDDADREQPLNRSAAAGGARGRAILYAAAESAVQVTAKADFLAHLLAKTPRDLYPAVARACERLLLEIPASAETRGAAPDLARALLALDRVTEARPWLALMAPADQAGLAPLLHLAHPTEEAWPAGALTDLVAGSTKDTGLAQRRALLVAQLLAAEGAPLPDNLILAVADTHLGGPVPGPGVLIANAAADKRLGLTVLSVLAALGDTGAAGPAGTIAIAVGALRQVGLGDAGRALALDAAIAAGL